MKMQILYKMRLIKVIRFLRGINIELLPTLYNLCNCDHMMNFDSAYRIMKFLVVDKSIEIEIPENIVDKREFVCKLYLQKYREI